MSNEVFFNELCLKTQPNNYIILQYLKECYKDLRRLKCTVCRVGNADHTSLQMYINTLSNGNRDAKNFMYSFFKSPYEDEITEDHVIEEFLDHEVVYSGVQAAGMTWSVINRTLVLSLLTKDIWDSPLLEANCHNNSVCIHNVTKGAHVEENRIWYENQQPVELLETIIKPNEKTMNCRDDHGKKELSDFWMKLRTNSYVVEMINSLPFNQYERKFVRKCSNDGKIELVLHWLDEGYGLVIQTTGRNLQETEKIADILTNIYDRRT